MKPNLKQNVNEPKDTLDKHVNDVRFYYICLKIKGILIHKCNVLTQLNAHASRVSSNFASLVSFCAKLIYDFRVFWFQPECLQRLQIKTEWKQTKRKTC